MKMLFPAIDNFNTQEHSTHGSYFVNDSLRCGRGCAAQPDSVPANKELHAIVKEYGRQPSQG
jgi:hypothetical protein